jgi:hypothetical protein
MSKYDEDEIQWSDDEKLFDSPIPPKTNSKDTSAPSNGNAVEGSAQTQQGKARQPHSQLDAEEAREAALQQELENVRKINTVIEGVVESLEKARGNMDVRTHIHNTQPSLLLALLVHGVPAVLTYDRTERLPHRKLSLHPPPDLVPYPQPNRAQPASDPQPGLARRNPRSC